METVNNALVEQFTNAVRSNDADRLFDLIHESPGLKSIINEPLFDFDSPAVVYSSWNSRLKMTETLLDLGADINARSTWWAGGFGVLPTDNAEMAQLLINRGAYIDIHAAAGMGMLDRVEALLAEQPDLVNSRGGDGKTPLHFASTVPIAERLLQLGADVEIRDIDHGSTPAQYAVLDRPDVCRFLIASGAKTDIFMLCALGDLAGVQRAVAANPDILNYRTGDWLEAPAPGGHIYIYTIGGNQTPLQVAAKFGHVEISDWLCANGAELDIFSAWDIGRREAIVKMLADDPSILNKTPLGCLGTWMHEAARKGNAGLFELLLTAKPDIEINDREYHANVLGWARHFGKADIVALIEQYNS